MKKISDTSAFKNDGKNSSNIKYHVLSLALCDDNMYLWFYTISKIHLIKHTKRTNISKQIVLIF